MVRFQRSETCVRRSGESLLGRESCGGRNLVGAKAKSISNGMAIRQLVERFVGSRFVRKVAALAGGTIIGQAVVVSASPVLTRLYSPDDFGVLAVYIALMGIVGTANSLRYEYAIPTAKSDYEGVCIAVAAVVALIATTAVVALVLWSGQEGIWSLLGLEALRGYAWLIPFGLFGLGLYRIFVIWSIHLERHVLVARTGVGQSVGAATAQVLLGIVLASPIGLLIGHIIGQSMGLTSLIRRAFRTHGQLFRQVTIPDLRRVAYNYRRYAQLSSVSSIIDRTGIYMGPILYTALYGSTVAGLVALAQRITSIPMKLLGKAVGNAYLGEAGKRLMGTETFERTYLRTAVMLFLVGAVPITALAIVSPTLFENVFGYEWREAGVYVQIMVPMLVSQLVIEPLAHTFAIADRHGQALALNIIKVIGVCVIVTGAASLDIGPRMMLGMYSTFFSVHAFVQFALGWRSARVAGGFDTAKHTRDMPPAPSRADV